MSDKKIFINEKSSAIKNGSKFVWPMLAYDGTIAGRVMVRRIQDERVHVVSLVADLGVILGPGGCQRAQLEPLSSDTPISLPITRDDGAEGGGTK